ncbi:RHTO0S06e04346g1_1 [Rhodotorula toruloides]|uniref:RHTO0S06e04346g1_1 n=2 Tax=Rhodotorula toruloides TaxID=5286 RepID=A0A061AWU9_RHOTO|nr:uncharacterized protein RHTO_06183 [Rhodotorula toruloides NP11]EMS24179.1 hypothetical protein RHTO_06183 [Rhodotorula toruloides NP11]CDR41695.1 RHTO0S06e04346g1_1 [Rhodotorula toruloides]
MSNTPAPANPAASTTSGAAVSTTQREDTGAGTAFGGAETTPLHSTHSHASHSATPSSTHSHSHAATGATTGTGPVVDTTQRQEVGAGSGAGTETAPLHSTHSHASHTGTPAPANPASSTTSGAAVDSTQRQDTGAGNVASGAETGAAAAGEGAEGSAATGPEGGYPEQVHAGKLGYGPHYAGNPGISDQLKGTEEIIKGKLTHKPELVQQGHDRKDGVLAERKREYEAEHDDGAFSKPAEGQGNPGGAKGANAPAGEAAGAKNVRESGDVAADKAATASTKTN